MDTILTMVPKDLSAKSASVALNYGFVQLLNSVTNDILVLAVVSVSVIFTLFKIRAIAVPFIKLAVVYYTVFVAALVALYGPEDLWTFTSFRQVRRSAKAAMIASLICFAMGLMTPKKARQSIR